MDPAYYRSSLKTTIFQGKNNPKKNSLIEFELYISDYSQMVVQPVLPDQLQEYPDLLLPH